MLKNIFNKFCSDTNIHGFAYISQPSRSIVEKIFWILSILTSFILTGHLILKLLHESQKNPTVIYTDQNAINIKELNFPAVSICPGLIYKVYYKTLIDYPVIKSQLLNHEKNISELSIKDLKLLQVASLVTRDHFLSENFKSLSIPTDDFDEVFQQFNLTIVPYYIYKMVIKNIVRPFVDMPPSNFMGSFENNYAVFVRQSVTEFGPCYTFNLPKITDIYSTNVSNKNIITQKDIELIGKYISISDTMGFWTQFENVSYPVKGSTEGLRMVMSIHHVDWRYKAPGVKYDDYDIFSYNHFNYSLMPNMNKFGVEIAIHDPYEVMPSTENHFTLEPSKLLYLFVTPVISRIDDSLMDKELNFRRCYLKNEKQLEFFKVYMKANCEHECLAQMTLKSCGCVQFFMARRPNTKICGIGDEKCFNEVENRFNEDKSVCKCYDRCDNIKYEVKLQNTENEAIYNSQPTVLVRMPVNSVYATRRRLSTTFVDFMSFVGGLLGLFLGFSFLSAAEVVYYFIIQPFLEMVVQRSTTVHPMILNEQSAADSSRCKKFVTDMLQSSSIHSLGSVGSRDKGVIERLCWLILLTTSIIFAFLMMNEVFSKFRNKNIVMKFDTSAINIQEVPFPALTIVRLVTYEDDYSPTFNSTLDFYDKHYIFELSFQVKIINRLFDSSDYALEYKSTSDFVDFLKGMSNNSKIPFDVHRATWNGNQKMVWTEVLTKQQIGRAFNLIEDSKLLNLDIVSKDFHYKYECPENCNYPLTTSIGDGKGLSVEFNIWNNYSRFVNIYHIHPPNELPLIGYQEPLKNCSVYDILVTPSITKADNDLKSLDVESRNCYFDGERKLKYFKIYTQKNCELECLSFAVYQRCTCVPYNYIRDSITDVCDEYATLNCYYYIANAKANDYDHLYESHGECRCLPACNEVKYSYEVYKNKFDRNLSISNSMIQMRWKDSEYYAMIRVQEFKLVDFFSYAGGILGLFAGISVLSIFEIFYFLTLRLWTDLLRVMKD